MTVDRDFPYEKLTYKVIGCLYEVFNDLGFGHPEKVYQKAIAKELGLQNIKFSREKVSKVRYKDTAVGYYYHDFLIENDVVLEIKVGNDFYQNHLRQVLTYLKDSKLRLGIVSIFSPNGVMIKRVLNSDLRSKPA